MIRHIIFWQFNDEVRKKGNEKEIIDMLRKSADTMVGHIDGLLSVDLSENIADSDYDIVYCADLTTAEALEAYQSHPLHVAHKDRSAPYLINRLVADYSREE